MRARVFVAAAALLAPAIAHADDLAPIGSRVRVEGVARVPDGSSAQERRLIGQVVATDGTALTVRRDDGDAFVLRWNEVERLDVSRGRRSRGAGALRGAGRGALFASALSLVLLAAASSGGNELEAGVAAFAAPALGATVGLVVGIASPGERWGRVRMDRARIRVVPTAGPGGRGAGLAVSVGF